MAYSKIQTLISKIQSIIGDEGSISRLEKDLVKDYLRELYDLTDALSLTGMTIQTKRTAPEIEPAPVPKIIVTTPPSAEASSPSRVTSLPEKEESESPVPDPPNPFRVPDPAETLVPREPYLPNGKGEHIQPETRSPGSENRNSSTIPQALLGEIPVPVKYESLFEASQARDLSDKLSRSPVTDLNRAFSINDRLLVVTDLFAGDQQKFQETIDILNSKYSFDEARSYLTRYIVDRYDWLNEEKSERAREFIKLVERRYIGH